MRMLTASGAVLCAVTASGQDLIVSFYATPLPDTYVVGGEYFGGLPGGSTSIGSIWADASFAVSGNGSTPIEFLAYNPAYDTTLGGPVVSDGLTGTFVGNTSSFFGTPDPSNPLFVSAFTYNGPVTDLSLSLVGQNSALYLGNPAEPFGTVLLYQDAFNNPGPLSFGVGFPGFNSVTLDQVPWIPAPATLALAPMALLAAGRRRR